MDLNLLKVFVSVSNKKSISLAANELKCAQSNVTSRIKQLEKTLDAQLFHRVPKGVILTESGKSFYPKAIEIIHKLEDAVSCLQKDTPMTHLRVGSTECNAAVRISPFLMQLHESFPAMHLELFTGTTQDVVQMILDFQVDIAFISGYPKSDKLMVLNVIEEDMALLESNDMLSPNVTLTFKKGCRYDEFLKEYMKQNNVEIEKSLCFGSLETILGCVKVGMGRTLLPMSLVEKMGYDKDIKITLLHKDDAHIPTTLVCRKDFVPSIANYLKELKL